MSKLKLLRIPLLLLSLSIVGCGQSIDSQAGLEETSPYETSEVGGDGEEAIENSGDEIDPDNMDRQLYDGETGEEVIEDPEDVVDLDNVDLDTIDRQPVYDGQPGEETVEDPADELDIDTMDRVEIEDL